MASVSTFSFLKSKLNTKSRLFKVKFLVGHKVSFLKSILCVTSRFVKSRLYCITYLPPAEVVLSFSRVDNFFALHRRRRRCNNCLRHEIFWRLFTSRDCSKSLTSSSFFVPPSDYLTGMNNKWSPVPGGTNYYIGWKRIKITTPTPVVVIMSVELRANRNGMKWVTNGNKSLEFCLPGRRLKSKRFLLLLWKKNFAFILWTWGGTDDDDDDIKVD